MVTIPKNPEILSSEILIKSASYTGWFFLLEGDFDQHFWTRHLEISNLRPINCVGKLNVLGTLDLLRRKSVTHKIIALVDKDYDEILVRLKEFPQLSYTDKNDLEVTLLLCQTGRVTAVERILQEKIDTDKSRQFEARWGVSVLEHLRQMTANYGVLRFLNERQGYGVNFENLPIRNTCYLNHITLQQDKSALQKAFLDAVDQSGKYSLSTTQLKTQIRQCRDDGLLSGWDLVQGHDFMKLLAVAINSNTLKRESGHMQVSERGLASDLCLVIRLHDLQTTNMLQSLQKQAGIAKINFFKA